SNNYWKRDNLFSLRYANWNKDKFMGILPNSQFGDLADADPGKQLAQGMEAGDFSVLLLSDCTLRL
ncbi:hypothetical protein OBE_07452, partial [human gut metagenome]